MQISELFENVDRAELVKKVNHAKTVQTIYALALANLSASAEIKEHAKFYCSSTDQFWSESIDEVTSALTRAFSGKGSFDSVYDYVDMSVNNVLENMYEFYLNKLNHEPDYMPPMMTGAYKEVQLSTEDIDAAFASYPGYAEAHKLETDDEEAYQQKRRQDHSASMTDEKITELANQIDEEWATAFNPALLAKITKKPKLYDFEDKFAPKNANDVINALIKMNQGSGRSNVATIADWIMAGSNYKYPHDTLRDDDLMKKVAAKSKHLARYLQK